MSAAVPGSCAPKSFEGTPSTTRPRAAKRWCSFSRSAYCGVKPQNEAVFTSSTGLPRKAASGSGAPSMVEREKSWAVLSAITLLRPGIAAHVVAAHFPKPGSVLGHECDLPDPLRALPEIELRHHGTYGSAVLAGDRLPLPGMCEQHIRFVEVGERQVRGVVVVARERQV